MELTRQEMPSVPWTRIPWVRSLLWLAGLAPFFFLSYGFANDLAAGRGVTRSVVFAWEPAIPFLAWTIVPYWSIDLLYGFGFLLCRTPEAVDRHARRLLSVQLLCVGLFLVLPLRFSFEKPVMEGTFALLFDALASFDQPYNQAPSLHIALLVVIWHLFRGASRGLWRSVVDGWALLIAISVLTTYQHHFIDLPTGALAGLFCLWLWPDQGASPLRRDGELTPRRLRLAAFYSVGAALCVAVTTLGGLGWIALWAAVALGLVALCYAWSGSAGFQKIDGRHTLASACLFAPYTLAAWLNSRAWTRRHPEPDAIEDGVYVGRIPSHGELSRSGISAVCDLTAELPLPRSVITRAHVPLLDLVRPDPDALVRAAREIERLRAHAERVLVCCALGYSRSALAVIAWLYLTGRVGSVDLAAARVRAARPRVVIAPEELTRLAAVLEAQRV